MWIPKKGDDNSTKYRFEKLNFYTWSDPFSEHVNVHSYSIIGAIIDKVTKQNNVFFKTDNDLF